MQLKPFRLGPIALTTTLTTNILNPPTAAGGTNGGSSAQYILLKHIRIVNKTGSAATVSLWIGATGANAAGTEFAWQATSCAANSFLDWFAGAPGLRLDSADFLVGGAGTATALSIEAEGEIGVSG
jgi:hypothetical protein